VGGKLVLADFTEEGLNLMDTIHRLEGNTHEVQSVTLEDAARYLEKKGFLVTKAESVFQAVCIAHRKVQD
jgi:hypothetical protein